MRGFDFNGVIDNGKYRPSEGDVIITGNTISMAKSVIVWLLEHNIFCAVYFNPYPNGANNRTVSGEWKAEIINKLELKTFYEDDPIQFEIIKRNCSKCEIKLV